MKRLQSYTGKWILALFTGSMLLTSCQRDLDNIVIDSVIGPDTTWLPNPDSSLPIGQLQQALLLQPHTDSFNLSPGTAATINASSGIRATVSAGSLVNDSSQAVFGRIYMESLLMTRNGDFIRMGIPTTNNNRAMEAGGAYWLRLYNNQSALYVGQGRQIIAQYDVPASFQNMDVFYGAPQSNPFSFNWTRAFDSTLNYIQPTGQSYRVYTNNLGWISPARPAGSIQQSSTAVELNLAPQYTNQNTRAYLVCSNKICVIPFSASYNLRKFIIQEVPSGEPARIVVLSKQGNDFYMGSESITTIPGTNLPQMVQVTPTLTSLNNMINYLSSL